MIFIHDVTKIFSRDPNYIVDVYMLPKFGKSSISLRSFLWQIFIKISLAKTTFLRSGLGWSLEIWDSN